MPDPVTAYIALGSNLGDRQANLIAALHKLEHTPGIAVRKMSSLIETAPVGGPEGSPPFLNAAAALSTTLSPDALLSRLLEVERELGRERREKWGPRTIDLDLLLYGNEVIDREGLRVPHPLMHERAFVLEPFAEIAPHVLHPVLGKTVLQLLQGLPREPGGCGGCCGHCGGAGK